jgi:hypothetical protein
MIIVGDIVFHTLSKLYFICENNKQERWMNMNSHYIKTNDADLPKTYFKKF